MIVQGTQFRVERVPLSRIVVTMQERRYPARVQEYYERLTDPQHAQDDVLLHLSPLPDAGYYTPLDGHHRLLALLMAGRRDTLALIIIEPGQCGYTDVDDEMVGVATAAAEAVGKGKGR